MNDSSNLNKCFIYTLFYSRTEKNVSDIHSSDRMCLTWLCQSSKYIFTSNFAWSTLGDNKFPVANENSILDRKFSVLTYRPL